MKEYDIVELAAKVDFEALNKTQQTFVLSTMSRAEFLVLRQSILKTKSIYAAQQSMPSKLDTKLTTAFRTQYPKQNFQTLIARPIPLWQAAAACFLLFLMSCYVLNQEDNRAITTKIIYVPQIDTIYLPSPVEEIPNFEEIENLTLEPQFIPEAQIPIAASGNNSEKAINTSFEMERSLVLDEPLVIFMNPSKSGQSIQDDTLLANFSDLPVR